MTLQVAPTPLLPQWSAELTTRSGLRLFVRPVSSDDDDLVDRFFASLSPEDLRFRFLTPLAHPSLSLLDALIKVDHVRTVVQAEEASSDLQQAHRWLPAAPRQNEPGMVWATTVT